MGIDLRTGPIGKTVRAPARGHVARVRCSPYGYGKAVYLKLDDGNMVIFGHLDDYAPGVSEYVRSVQHRRESYTVDLYLQPGDFPVARGDLVAYSGQTGIGAPHLHYEIRDSSGVPINPRLIDIDWLDSTPPEILKVLVVPKGEGSRINGDIVPVVLEVVKDADGLYATPAIQVAGSIGIAADVKDTADGTGRLGLHTLRLEQGGQERFRIVHDHVSYDHDQDSAVSYHPYFLEQGRFLLLWRWENNESELYSEAQGDGWLEESFDDVFVDGTDFHGNTTRVRIPIEPEKTNDVGGRAESAPATRGELRYENFGYGLVVTAQFDGAEDDAPTLTTKDGPRLMTRIAPDFYRELFVPSEGDIELQATHPRIEATSHTTFVARRGDPRRVIQSGELIVEIDPESPYDMLMLRVERASVKPQRGLVSLGSAWRVLHEASPIDVAVNFRFPFENASADFTAGLYRHNGKRWAYQNAQRDAQGFELSVRSLGTYAIMRDSSAPTLRIVGAPDEGTTELRPTLSATVDDAESGIESFSIHANGQWLLASYDPERKTLEWERDEDLTSSEQEIVFRVIDFAGNETVETSRFLIR